jgi:hypothetical protein
MKKYVVSQSHGEYEDRYETPIGVYDTREAAEKFIEGEIEWKKRTKQIAIKNIIISEWDETKNSYDYDNLEEAYSKWLWDTVIGDKPEEEVTNEEYEKLDDCSMDEWLPKFMAEKGYSKEVIEATMIYNDWSDYSRYRQWYYVKEVPYYPET